MKNAKRIAPPLVATLLSTLVVAASATPAGASDVLDDALQLSVAVASDGLGRFSDDDRPGGDSGPGNGLVRTADAIVYGVMVSTTSGSAADGVVTLTAPSGLAWSRLPDECSSPGSSIQGDTLTCALGTITSGVRSISVAAAVSTSAHHGSTVQPVAAAVAAGQAEVTAEVPAVTVSAVPRFDLSMNRAVPSFTPTPGPDGITPGYRIVYPLSVHWEGLVDGGGLLGYEQLDGRMTIVDDVSGMYGGEASPAVLASVDGAPACGVNTGQISAAPGGAGGGEGAVVDSGTVTCTQAGPGHPVVIEITGADTSLASIPVKSVSGGEIAGGVVPSVVSAYVSLWVPVPPLGESLTAVNTYRDFAAESVSGRTNYDGESEPLDDNTVSRNLLDSAGVSGSTRYRGWDTGTSTSFTLSGKYDEPYVTPAQTLITNTSITNSGRAAWAGTITCTVFDTDQHTLRENTPGSWAASNRAGVTGAPEFAAFDASDPSVARDATCGDDDLAWHDDPEDVPGGPDAVGAVRWTYDHPGTTSITFNTHVSAEPRLENHARMRTFSSVRRTATSGWTHDRNDPAQANGAWADFLSVTGNLARITSAVVDPGHGAGDTPDETTYVTAGGRVTYVLRPSLTNASDDRLPETLVVRDVLPAGAEYVDGSASLAPVVDEVDVEGVARQRLTWTTDEAVVNEPIAPVTFEVRFVSAAAGAEAINSASVEASRDVSPEARRTTERALHVLAGSGFDADETVDSPVHVVGDDVVFTLSYRNAGSEALPGSTVVTVLPHGGDGRGTSESARPRLVRPVEPASPGETVLYTSATADRVSDDPAHSSNAPGGSTTWCALDALGSPGCPLGLDDVTAVRIDRLDAVERGGAVDHDLVLATADQEGAAETWASTFGLRVLGLDHTTRASVVTTTSVAGSVSGLAWLDDDADGVRSVDESRLFGHQVDLTGTDDRGDPVAVTATTSDDGEYAFTGLRPGAYAVAFGASSIEWTAPFVGDEPALDSDVDQAGVARTSLVTELDADGRLVGVSSAGHVNAGALPSPDVEPPVIEPPVVEPPVIEPPVIEPPVVASGAGDPDDPATRAEARPTLAFTGGHALGAVALATALVGIGAGLRRRRRGAEAAAADA
ncbi:hypothetical protein ES689_10625 [Frigoribacterium sp. ACAM 257]|uniref:SdrD B-like domain-containing protein n=1 Tax=Frigoribacterium sp. ACAM 257 TaxID=2508998 RepID=UPI0011B9BBC6|nr:SdrD B-like domain-containing protein [Frigoribacterium sp. ACAM 257]TWX37128.1 hypothetical protein ES689_10625 [Frigoribacterium sp. ACAM 257]